MIFCVKYIGDKKELKEQGLPIGWTQVSEKACMNILYLEYIHFTKDQIINYLKNGETLSSKKAEFIAIN